MFKSTITKSLAVATGSLHVVQAVQLKASTASTQFFSFFTDPEPVQQSSFFAQS